MSNLVSTQKEINRIITGSKEYFIKGDILVIRDYYNVNGKRIEIDLRKLTPDVLKKIAPYYEGAYEEDE